MFKFVVLSCLVSVAFAGLIPAPVHYAAPAHYAQVKTIVEPHYSVVETPTINQVGAVVKNVPTGVSHHSSSVVHSHANHVENVYAHGVEQKVVSTPVVKQVVEHVAAPVVVAAPAVKYISAPVAYAAAPVHAHSAYAYPSAHSSYAAYQPAVQAYSSYPAVHSAYPAVSAYSAYPAAHQYAHHY